MSLEEGLVSLEDRIYEIAADMPKGNIQVIAAAQFVAKLQSVNGAGASFCYIESYGMDAAVQLLVTEGILEVFERPGETSAPPLKMVRFSGLIPQL